MFYFFCFFIKWPILLLWGNLISTVLPDTFPNSGNYPTFRTFPHSPVPGIPCVATMQKCRHGSVVQPAYLCYF